jgi:hypothetical protein
MTRLDLVWGLGLATLISIVLVYGPALQVR